MLERQGKTIGRKLAIKRQEGLLGNGPATYYADKLKKENVAFSMRPKPAEIDFNGNLLQPGPCNYSPRRTDGFL